jgi:cytoskeletal protein CcmA (bactofilin family)
MNTKGIKFLAVLAVLAMAFAAIAVISYSDDSDAAYAAGEKYVIGVQGPLNFTATNDDDGDVSNKALGNNILVSYDAESKKYTVTGTLAQQNLTDTTSAFYQLWPENATTTKEYKHGFVFGLTATGSTKVTFTGDKTYDYGNHFASAADTVLIYVKSQKVSTLEITGGTYAGKYTIDLTGVTLSSTVTTQNGYVALANANALAGITSGGVDVNKGTDGSTGKWTYDYESNTLTLTDYKGEEWFTSGKAAKFNVVLSGTNTITVEAYNSMNALSGYNSTLQAMTVTSTAASSIEINLTEAETSVGKNITALAGHPLTIGNANAEANGIITITANAPYAGIYTYGSDGATPAASLVLQNAIVTASSGEKAVNVNDNALKMTNSKLTAKMGDIYFNKEGDDKRFGIRAPSLNMTDTVSEIITQGLIIEKDQAVAKLAGKITVSGDYEQSAPAYIAGFQYNGNITKLEAYTGIEVAAGKIVVDSAKNVMGLVEVTSPGDTKEKEIVDQKTTPEATAEAIKDLITNTNKADIVDAYITTQAVTLDVTIPVDKTLIMHVTSDSTAKVNGTVKFADDNKNAITMTNVTGTFKIIKGSIYIDDAEVTGGSFTLAEGADAKINGIVDGNFTINVAGDKKATLTIEEGKKLKVNNKTLTLGTGITFNIEGTLEGGSTLASSIVDSTCTINVKDGGVVEGVTLTDVATKTTTVNALSGSKVTGKVSFDKAGSEFIAMTGSDINSLNADSSWDYISGKDDVSGSWTYDGVNTLNLNNYNGTYNFESFKGTLVSIKLTGDSKVSYAFDSAFPDTAAKFVLFGNAVTANVSAITTATEGSLEVDVDISKVAKDKLFTHPFIVINGAAVDINGVSLTINVTGQNSEWTVTETEAMKVTGITATTFKTFNASLVMDILSDYTSKDRTNVIGVDASSTVTIGTGGFSVASAGTAVESGDKVTISGVLAVGMEGNKAGLVVENNKDVEITSTLIMAVAGGITNGNGALKVQETTLNVSGDSAIGSIVEKNASNVKFTDFVNIVGIIDLTQKSVLEINDGQLDGVITNGGSIITNGNVVVTNNSSTTGKGGDANSTWINNGTLGMYGKYVSKGEFINNGTFSVFKDKVVKDVAEQSITIGNGHDDPPTDATKVRIGKVTIDSVKSINADGTATVKASLTPQYKGGDVFVAVGLDKFEGILTPSQTDAGFTLTMSNGTASFTITYNTKNNTVGEGFIITVSGALQDADGKLRYMDANTTGATAKAVDHASFDTLMTDPAAVFTADDGKVTNTDTFVVYSPASSSIDTEYVGDITVYAATKFEINGKFTGNVTVNGAAAVDLKSGKTMVGNITADGKVTISGTLTGDITAKDEVEVKKVLNGNITINANDKKVTVTAGKIDGTITYNSKYKADKDTKDGDETTYTATMDVKGEGTFVINLAAGANATASTPVIPGFFTLGAMTALDDKYVELKLTSGDLKAPVDATVPARYSIIIEKDTTIEVAKTAKLNVKESALKVSKDAIAHFETGSGVATTYGKVEYIMSFAIDDGAYTIYSDVAYALSNCNEGAELTVGSDAPISSNVSVKAGVNIIVDSVTVTFNGYNVEMGENAKFTLLGTGKLVFKESGNNGYPDDEAWQFYSVSATIVYGDNTVALEDVRFNGATDSEITGVAATSTADAKINTKLIYNEGKATIATGYGTGSITLSNASYKLLKDDTTNAMFSGTFAVAADAVFDAVAINDEFAVVDYIREKATDVPSIKEYKKIATVVLVMGTLNLTNTTTVKGAYAGNGTIALADGKEFIMAASADLPAAVGPTYPETYENFTVPGIVAGKILDTTDEQNGYVFNLVSPVENRTITLKATTQKISGETYKVMTIKGDVKGGVITTDGEAVLLGLNLAAEHAVLVADTVYVMGASEVKGYLAAETIYMKTGTETSEFSTLKYEVRYEDDDGYTVYTVFENVDFEEVSDIVLDGYKKEYSLSEFMGDKTKLDLSGQDVNIIVAEGKTLKIDRTLIIGTPITVLGDGEGSSIVGKIIINVNSGVPMSFPYLVAYADVDLSFAEIEGLDTNGAKVLDVVSSRLDVEDVLYATIFAADSGNNTPKLATADKSIIPEIVGYNFTAWINYNGDTAAKIGETNAYADAKATYVTVIVKYVAGVDYYMNGSLFDALNVYTDVPYGSYFTAKISDTSKYQGNPLVNGEKTVYVIEDTELVASGVTPIPEPPAPEPVVGDSGLSLTDILLIVLVILIAIMVVILVLRLNRS